MKHCRIVFPATAKTEKNSWHIAYEINAIMKIGGKKLLKSFPTPVHTCKIKYQIRQVIETIKIFPKIANTKAMYSTKVNRTAFLRIKMKALNADKQK